MLKRSWTNQEGYNLESRNVCAITHIYTDQWTWHIISQVSLTLQRQKWKSNFLLGWGKNFSVLLSHTHTHTISNTGVLIKK